MKIRATISLDPTVWKQFRMSCIEHDTNASAELEAYMKTRLQQWEKGGGKKK
jgi:hypothetical protein